MNFLPHSNHISNAVSTKKKKHLTATREFYQGQTYRNIFGQAKYFFSHHRIFFSEMPIPTPFCGDKKKSPNTTDYSGGVRGSVRTIAAHTIGTHTIGTQWFSQKAKAVSRIRSMSSSSRTIGCTCSFQPFSIAQT